MKWKGRRVPLGGSSTAFSLRTGRFPKSGFQIESIKPQPVVVSILSKEVKPEVLFHSALNPVSPTWRSQSNSGSLLRGWITHKLGLHFLTLHGSSHWSWFFVLVLINFINKKLLSKQLGALWWPRGLGWWGWGEWGSIYIKELLSTYLNTYYPHRLKAEGEGDNRGWDG